MQLIFKQLYLDSCWIAQKTGIDWPSQNFPGLFLFMTLQVFQTVLVQINSIHTIFAQTSCCSTATARWPNFRVPIVVPPMEARDWSGQNSSGSVFYGSILTVWCVARPIWELLSHHSHLTPFLPRLHAAAQPGVVWQSTVKKIMWQASTVHSKYLQRYLSMLL